MDIRPILAAIEEMTPHERQQVKARLELLEGGAGEPLPWREASGEEALQAAREIMTRFPGSLRKLAE